MTALSDKEKSDKPRRPGRPRGKKPDTASREQLMDIALALFAREGIARVSLNAIAREAGVTPAMLHYYFSSRDALVEQLLEERFMPLRERIGAIFLQHPDDPVSAFTQMVRVLAELADGNAWFAPLWMQEMSGGVPVLRQKMSERVGDESYRLMLARIADWQAAGRLNPDLTPALLFPSLISLVLVPFARARNDERIRSISPEQIVSHALAMIGQGLRAGR
ncbi:TetR family transcriptional regulator [Pluralibacter gergoviae]|uniref:TetR/AcrR family transcriptional regulator n=1 Tax=Pluralibacter gergoviae TaxID=61647 RepID=UPI0004F5C3E6|nr:TetR/AcrR family transcriptional regulator [Pluralibacter gergoviae]AIQ99111.1 TetR family transcriptional regulator [Pluralibacter gergoviae]EKT9640271.1 TetR/AcrR family transcriptional regulator [Pluralibacter gergoviae]EKV3542814.1 TetR/AcrR family transcriptional regulator [Pluralibacter gergoviae]EKV9898070.1 TetR/AcrR family transcriptional regulator [Pluralibacter gergoviae]EKV9929273.1 TetR/AcrR family transcriptional regulator [Pluralibacter gergoviae]